MAAGGRTSLKGQPRRQRGILRNTKKRIKGGGTYTARKGDSLDIPWMER